MSPELNDDGSYDVILIVGDTTTSGKSVIFPPSTEDSGDDEWGDPNVDPAPPDEWGAKPVPVDGDGTLATLIFEVIEAKPAAITLLDINLSDTDDVPLESTLENSLIILNAADAGGRSAADVNGDGKVNILDLVFVAGKFGQPVTDPDQAADVNGDGKINILDLVLIAQHFGN